MYVIDARNEGGTGRARRACRGLILALGVLASAACTPRLDVRGNLPDPEDVLAVQPGITTREQVAQILGSPSTIGTFDDNTWYYLSKRTETVSFLPPDVVDQEVLIIKFDDDGVVSDMKLYGDEIALAVEPVERTTPNLGQEMTVLQQLFGNIGRFNKPMGETTTVGATGRTGPGSY